MFVVLVKYLGCFRDCFDRKDTRAHLATYVEGQLSQLDRKRVEPNALAANVAPRTLQQFLNSLEWNQDQLIDTLQQRVARDHTSDRSIGLIDETSCPKKGEKTPGVQRQWCGATGKQDNCVTSVHLGCAVDDFHCLLGSELFLPEGWSEDRPRCRAAHVPDEMTYRAKWRIALELYDRARGNGVTFRYLTFDEGSGGKPEFPRQLAARGQAYVAEVPRTSTGGMHAPYVTYRPYRRGGRGRGRAVPRVGHGIRPARSVERHLRESDCFTDQPWRRWRVKETQKGPMVWETKHARIVPKDGQGLPGKPLHLIVARNVRDTAEVKFFLSNAPAETPLKELLVVALSRWRVERRFEDQKTELRFDHFEGRSYLGSSVTRRSRPSATCSSRRSNRGFGKKHPELTVCQVRTATDAMIRSRRLGRTASRLLLPAAQSELEYTQRRNAQARRSPTKTTYAKFTALGIRLARLPRCQWTSS